jgi:hypothetical protein
MDVTKVKAIEDEIRDLINWIAVFETEYNLDKEIVDQLRNKLEDLSKKVNELTSG